MIEPEFRISPLSETRIKSIKTKTEWTPTSPIPLERLKEVHFIHTDFEGGISQGQMIVLDELAESALSIFIELNELRFPIWRAIPIDEYYGDDVASMADNNSSGFNARKVMNTNRWSSHAYGVAIDINPAQNPYVIKMEEDSTKIFPEASDKFLDRTLKEKGMGESIVSVFAKHGFSEWGGNWQSPLDYHHFQIPWDRITT